MGYHSDVKLIIQGPEEEILVAWAEFRFRNPWSAEHSSDQDPCVQHMSITKDSSDKLATIVFEAEQWKWYTGYTDIDRIESMWSFFLEKSNVVNGIIGRFVRVGEDEEDNENRAFGEDCYDISLCINRSIYSDDHLDLENDVRSKL